MSGNTCFTTQGGTGREPLLDVQQFTRVRRQKVIRGQLTLIFSLAFAVAGWIAARPVRISGEVASGKTCPSFPWFKCDREPCSRSTTLCNKSEELIASAKHERAAQGISEARVVTSLEGRVLTRQRRVSIKQIGDPQRQIQILHSRPRE